MTNRITKYLGMTLVLAGVILLLVFLLAGWNANGVLAAGWLLVVSGVVLHVWRLKRDGKY